jgi:hypothetical protein
METVNGETTEQTATFSEFAKLLRVKPAAVTQLKAADRLVLTDDGKRVRVEASLARIRETADPSKAAVAARHAAGRGEPTSYAAPSSLDEGEGQEDDDEPTAGDTPAYQRSRAKREHYLALQEQRAYEESVGKLLDAEEVVSAVSSGVRRLREALERLPIDLAPELAALTDEEKVRDRLSEAVEHALDDLSRRFAAIGKAELV